MSRFDEGYDEDFQNQAALYQANTRRALKGRKGQAFLKEMEEALVALPMKKLIEGRICEAGQVCAMGAFALKRRRDAGADIKAALDWLEAEDPGEGDATETALFSKKHFGVMECLSFEMAWVNDDDNGVKQADEDRYERVLKWVRSRIKKEGVSDGH